MYKSNVNYISTFQLAILLSSLCNPSNLLPSPQLKELEDSLLAEKKKATLASLRIKRIENELLKVEAAREAAEKETNDLAIYHAMQESQVHVKALVEGVKSCLGSLFNSEPGQRFLHSL